MHARWLLQQKTAIVTNLRYQVLYNNYTNIIVLVTDRPTKEGGKLRNDYTVCVLHSDFLFYY